MCSADITIGLQNMIIVININSKHTIQCPVRSRNCSVLFSLFPGSLINSSSIPKEAEFHGFSPAEIRLAGLKSELLQKEADQCRADIWACKGELRPTWSSFLTTLFSTGVALDPAERANIRRHSTGGLVRNINILLTLQNVPFLLSSLATDQFVNIHC